MTTKSRRFSPEDRKALMRLIGNGAAVVDPLELLVTRLTKKSHPATVLAALEACVSSHRRTGDAGRPTTISARRRSRLSKIRDGARALSGALFDEAKREGVLSSVRSHLLTAYTPNPPIVRDALDEWRDSLRVLELAVSHKLGEGQHAGRPIGDARRLADHVAQILVSAGVNVTKSEDGTFARVLEVVFPAAGVPCPQNLFKILKASVDDLTERRRSLAMSIRLLHGLH